MYVSFLHGGLWPLVAAAAIFIPRPHHLRRHRLQVE
jgi:hypothetical protein